MYLQRLNSSDLVTVLSAQLHAKLNSWDGLVELGQIGKVLVVDVSRFASIVVATHIAEHRARRYDVIGQRHSDRKLGGRGLLLLHAQVRLVVVEALTLELLLFQRVVSEALRFVLTRLLLNLRVHVVEQAIGEDAARWLVENGRLLQLHLGRLLLERWHKRIRHLSGEEQIVAFRQAQQTQERPSQREKADSFENMNLSHAKFRSKLTCGL